MPKLQKIERNNGSVIFSLNIPAEFIEMMNVKKGDDLKLCMRSVGMLKVIIISKEEI